MANAIPGQPYTLYLDFYNEQTGVLTQPGTVQLDITYGGVVGSVPDVAGPFTYLGAVAPTAGQVWNISTGQFAFTWPVPADLVAGVYTANWSIGFGVDTFLTEENFYVQGAEAPGGGGAGGGVISGDLGYWTGGLIYQAAGLDVEFGTVDSNGIAWLWNKIDGWDSPDVQGGGVIPKSGDHGAWASPQYYAARQLTLTVTASAPTQALRDLARSILQQAVPVSDLATLRYDEPISKTALVRRSGKVTEAYPTLSDVQFTIGLVAPDPRKYNAMPQMITVNAGPDTTGGFTVPVTVPFSLPAVVPGGTIAATNNGNFETRPVITITGPVTGPALVNVTTGQQVSWSQLTIPAGQAFTVDFNLAQGTLQGAYRAADPFSSWWTLPPGTSTIALDGSDDTGATMSILFADAWT